MAMSSLCSQWKVAFLLFILYIVRGSNAAYGRKLLPMLSKPLNAQRSLLSTTRINGVARKLAFLVEEQPLVLEYHNAGGLSLWCLGGLVTLKALANETGGNHALHEDIIPPGIGLPLHLHTREEETWYIVDGELIWNVGGKSFHATKGSSLICLEGYLIVLSTNLINQLKWCSHMPLVDLSNGFWVSGRLFRIAMHLKKLLLTPELLDKALKLGEAYGLTFVDHHADKDEADFAENAQQSLGGSSVDAQYLKSLMHQIEKFRLPSQAT